MSGNVKPGVDPERSDYRTLRAERGTCFNPLQALITPHIISIHIITKINTGIRYELVYRPVLPLVTLPLVLSYKYTCRFKMSNYKHFSRMYILVRVALIFHCALCLMLKRSETSLWSLAESLKMEIFPWLSNIYRWRIYL